MVEDRGGGRKEVRGSVINNSIGTCGCLERIRTQAGGRKR